MFSRFFHWRCVYGAQFPARRRREKNSAEGTDQNIMHFYVSLDEATILINGVDTFEQLKSSVLSAFHLDSEKQGTLKLKYRDGHR